MLFSTDISSSLVDFIEEMHNQPNPVDLDLCCDFVENQGVTLTPAVIEQIDLLLRFTTN
jgi:hypothetical protein